MEPHVPLGVTRVAVPGKETEAFPSPEGCRFFSYGVPGKPLKFICYLPRGVKSLTNDGKEQNWTSRTVGVQGFTAETAKQWCQDFLNGAVSAGLVQP